MTRTSATTNGTGASADSNSSLLDSSPRTSTSAQRQRIMVLASRKGLDLAAARTLAGVDRLHDLSARGASELIERLGGGDLPSPPNTAPRRRPPPAEGVVRMITGVQIQTINRLGLVYFGNKTRFHDWLMKNYGVDRPRDLECADWAGKIIGVLKTMIRRKQAARQQGAEADEAPASSR